MKLTGKCKEDFEMFIFRQKGTLPKGIESYNYYDLQESYIISDIVNWFDSVEIYIIINIENYFYYEIEIEEFTFRKRGFGYNSRLSANKAAIIKANEIYNDKQIL